MHPKIRLIIAAAPLLALSQLCGCGGSSAQTVAPVAPPVAIQGVSTPSSVAVVTATNAS